MVLHHVVRIVFLCLTCASLSQAATAQAESLQALATMSGADRQQRLEEGARKEAVVVFYTTTPAQYVKMLVEPFEKKYGVKVDVWRARSELILQRVVNEARAGKPRADVVASISPPIEAMRREHLLQAIHSPRHKELLPSAAPSHGQWASTLQYVFVQAYNTQKVKKEDLPKTYEDLLDPRWQDKLAIEGSDHEWVSAVIDDMGGRKGEQFFKDLVGRNHLSVRNGHPLLTNLVGSGEVPLALTVYQYSVEQAKKTGAPIDWLAIEPAITIADAMAVPRGAPHPHAALLFYDYMISEQAQKILAKIGYLATNTKIEQPVKRLRLKVLDPATLLDRQDMSYARFESILRTSQQAAPRAQ